MIKEHKLANSVNIYVHEAFNYIADIVIVGRNLFNGRNILKNYILV